MRRGLRFQYNSPVVLSFALLSLGALLLGVFTGGRSTRLLFSVYRCPMNDLLAYPRFVLHVLGHSGYAHYIGNMMMILVVGPPLEEKDGCIPITLILVLLLYVGGEIVDGVVLSDNVSQLTHIIGGICGAVLGLSMRR